MISPFRFMRVTDREQCSPLIVPITLNNSELPIKQKHILLIIHDSFDICATEWRAFRLRLLVQKCFHILQIFNIVNIICAALNHLVLCSIRSSLSSDSAYSRTGKAPLNV
jgi:hypothetical protein